MGLPGFDFQQRSEVWDEFRQLTAGRPCDMSGITAERLRRKKSLQWPCPTADHPGTKRRYLDHVFATSSGPAALHLPALSAAKEPADREFPFVLTTGRLYAHWHTLTRTGKVDKLLKRDPEPSKFILETPSGSALKKASGYCCKAVAGLFTCRHVFPTPFAPVCCSHRFIGATCGVPIAP